MAIWAANDAGVAETRLGISSGRAAGSSTRWYVRIVRTPRWRGIRRSTVPTAAAATGPRAAAAMRRRKPSATPRAHPAEGVARDDRDLSEARTRVRPGQQVVGDARIDE